MGTTMNATHRSKLDHNDLYTHVGPVPDAEGWVTVYEIKADGRLSADAVKAYLIEPIPRVERDNAHEHLIAVLEYVREKQIDIICDTDGKCSNASMSIELIDAVLAKVK